MQKKMKNKKLFNIIVALFILLIILSIILAITKKYVANNKIPDDLEFINGDVEDESDKYEYPYMAYMLFIEYEGKLKPDDIVKSIFTVSNEVIPNYYKILKKSSDSEIINYYEQNQESIAETLGIEQEEFINIVKEIKKLNMDELVFESYRIDSERIEEVSNAIETILYITYENSQEIGFNVKIYNDIQEDKSSVVYTVMKENNTIE